MNLDLLLKKLKLEKLFNSILFLSNQRMCIEQIEKITMVCKLNSNNFEQNFRAIADICKFYGIDVNGCKNYNDIILKTNAIKNDINMKFNNLIKKAILDEAQEKAIKAIFGIC